MGTRVTVKSRGALDKPLSATILDPRHMRAIGKDIAAPVRENLLQGLDADGNPLPPEVGAGNGVPGVETGNLAKSVGVRRTSRGELVVSPDYRRYRYGIYLTVGVDKVETLKRIIAGKQRKRRDYKTTVDRRQVARPFMGMASSTLDRVADKNAERFAEWLSGSGLSAITAGQSAIKGAL